METRYKTLSECRVLVVDDEPGSQILLQSLVEPYIPCDYVAHGQEAIEYCQTQQPDLVLLDMEMPGMNGLEVCRQLKINPLTASIPVIFITASIDDNIQNQCWEASGSDFIRKPVNASTLLYRIKHHIHHKLQFEMMEKLTYRDQLTGLYNRTYLSEEIPLTLRQCVREQSALSILLLDLDNFKILNDTYGHLYGDMVLQKTGQVIIEQLKRPMDTAIRYGGEEFLIILPETEQDGAIEVASRVLEHTHHIDIPTPKAIRNTITMSAGIATAQPLPSPDLKPLLTVADLNLYQAKNKGKDRYDISHQLSD